jgi:hypothetical protein
MGESACPTADYQEFASQVGQALSPAVRPQQRNPLFG